MSKVRVCFLGTPDFAVVALRALLSDDHFEVVGVVSQPDRPAGRKMILTPSPVKNLALEKGLPVITPESVNKDFVLDQIKAWGAEVAVVVAFGQILSTKFLNIFNFGAVNIHGSLLPLWRGAAPIQRSIEAGDLETGVALQKIVRELDAGDVLGVRKINISQDMNAQELHDQLAKLGAELLHVELMDYVRGNLAGVPQDHQKLTYAKKIDKSESLLDLNQSARSIHNKIRAFVMGPGTFVMFRNKKLKIHKTALVEGTQFQKTIEPENNFKVTDLGKRIGRVCDLQFAGQPAIVIETGLGALAILELQPESRNKQSASDFLKSHHLSIGDYLV